ncbi:MAG: hypothetical protein BWY59_00054 [Verrucomicrobia bacterium ADurb.Bin345]|nr:MAG: hypothetical protein BWY59_00054 [Verrucomicrobia bacterium ADurb.Bin345]
MDGHRQHIVYARAIRVASHRDSVRGQFRNAVRTVIHQAKRVCPLRDFDPAPKSIVRVAFSRRAVGRHRFQHVPAVPCKPDRAKPRVSDISDVSRRIELVCAVRGDFHHNRIRRSSHIARLVTDRRDDLLRPRPEGHIGHPEIRARHLHRQPVDRPLAPPRIGPDRLTRMSMNIHIHLNRPGRRKTPSRDAVPGSVFVVYSARRVDFLGAITGQIIPIFVLQRQRSPGIVFLLAEQRGTRTKPTGRETMFCDSTESSGMVSRRTNRKTQRARLPTRSTSFAGQGPRFALRASQGKEREKPELPIQTSYAGTPSALRALQLHARYSGEVPRCCQRSCSLRTARNRKATARD